ncbi:unnamed protein product, partial [Prorocentrum cordatum]
MDGDLAKRVLSEVRRLQPPSTTPSREAAMLRLRNAASAADHQTRCTYVQKVAELGRRLADSCGRLSDRGETLPAQWECVDIPPPGSRPISARSVSPRVARKLEGFKTEMLKADGEECVQSAEVKNYVDQHCRRKKNMMGLAKRMASAGMLCRCEEKVDEVGLFCVVKKAEVVGSEVALRLVFDQRRSNLRWQRPPWFAMGGVNATPHLYVSEEMKYPAAEMKFGTGDLPDFYYMLDLGEDLAPYFVLPTVKASELVASLPDDVVLTGQGEYLGIRVALMGFSWACWMAQTTMEDLFNGGPQLGLGCLSEKQRLAEGGHLPQISREAPAVQYEHIDDFGMIGVDFAASGSDPAPPRVRDMWLGAKRLVRSAGFQVHKDDCSEEARVIGGDFSGTRLAPNQDNMWMVVAGIEEIGQAGVLSEFAEVYQWSSEARAGPRQPVPREVLKKLAVVAAIVPLISVDLAMPWDPLVTMFDASLSGGAIIGTESTREEQRREARFAVRGGWTVWTGISSSWAAEQWSEGETYLRVMEGVELGNRIRVPPVHSCWDDLSRWRELMRSATAPILILCRRMASPNLGCGKREHWRWAPSDRNHSDRPIRGFPVGQAPKHRSGTTEVVLPSSAAEAMEELVEIAEEDPFEPLRCRSVISVRGPGVLAATSGGPASLRLYLLMCTNVDVGFGAEFDLTDEENVTKWEMFSE